MGESFSLINSTWESIETLRFLKMPVKVEGRALFSKSSLQWVLEAASAMLFWSNSLKELRSSASRTAPK